MFLLPSGNRVQLPALPAAAGCHSLASTAALASGSVWSFGAVLARLADDADAFQYLIWRSIAIVARHRGVAARSAPAGSHAGCLPLRTA